MLIILVLRHLFLPQYNGDELNFLCGAYCTETLNCIIKALLWVKCSFKIDRCHVLFHTGKLQVKAVAVKRLPRRRTKTDFSFCDVPDEMWPCQTFAAFSLFLSCIYGLFFLYHSLDSDLFKKMLTRPRSWMTVCLMCFIWNWTNSTPVLCLCLSVSDHIFQ